MIRNILLLLIIAGTIGCQECSVIEDAGNPDQFIRVLNEQGDNLLFGNSAIYNPDSIAFDHQREGLLQVTPDPASGSVIIQFPKTRNQPEEISLRLDSNTTHTLTYNTLVYTNDKCEQVYSLSYVKLDGEQVCGSCGDTEFNSDKFIVLRL